MNRCFSCEESDDPDVTPCDVNDDRFGYFSVNTLLFGGVDVGRQNRVVGRFDEWHQSFDSVIEFMVT